jgi:tight adherence protein C
MVLGASATLGLRWLGAFDLMEARLRRFPAGLGDIFLPFFWAAPLVIPVVFALFPLIVLGRLRRERQRSMEEDLPVTLELLAILCESGQGLDAALEALIRAQVRPRPLALELMGFLVDARAGRPRVQSFRRLGHRVGLLSFETFVASIIQAEQAGAPMAEALRRQAYAMREQRREKAMEAAMSLPVKRMLPMAICFLPALFIVSLGPIFYDILQFFDALALRRAAF